VSGTEVLSVYAVIELVEIIQPRYDVHVVDRFPAS